MSIDYPNRLTLIGKGSRPYHMLYRCSCGKEKEIDKYTVQNGLVRSCGCLLKEILVKRNTTHGLRHHPYYALWYGIKGRCEDPTHPAYKWYGAKGVKLCDRWQDFALFVKDVGERPSPKHSIDRYPDRKGNYNPDNFRWATGAEQRRNHTNVVLVTYKGVTLCLMDWALKLGVHYARLQRKRDKLGALEAVKFFARFKGRIPPRT